MNRIRIIGLVMLVTGVAIPFLLKNEWIDFIFGCLGGVGFVLLITGRIKFKKQT